MRFGSNLCNRDVFCIGFHCTFNCACGVVTATTASAATVATTATAFTLFALLARCGLNACGGFLLGSAFIHCGHCLHSQRFFARLVPDGDPLFVHTVEGDDDMPAHLRTALTTVNLSIPVASGRLTLGTWQGIYVWEHRTAPHRRSVVVHTIGGDV